MGDGKHFLGNRHSVEVGVDGDLVTGISVIIRINSSGNRKRSVVSGSYFSGSTRRSGDPLNVYFASRSVPVLNGRVHSSHPHGRNGSIAVDLDGIYFSGSDQVSTFHLSSFVYGTGSTIGRET